MKAFIPVSVQKVIEKLHHHKFQAYVVGGAVRDLYLRKEPNDWDVASDAKPEDVERIFPKTIATGRSFGTMTVLQNRYPVQVTTFRAEGKYRDHRRPTTVLFHADLMADLARRDFTMNALAYDPGRKKFVDPFGGIRDLKRKRLRAVGVAKERLAEDALRIIRAGRFISQFDLTPDPKLTLAARQTSKNVLKLSAERIRDEFSKLLIGKTPSRGLLWLDRVQVLKLILPRLEDTKEVGHGGLHRYDVFHHTLRSLDLAPADLTIRTALLFHDIEKPKVRTHDEGGYHYFGHDKKGAVTSAKILRKLRYSNDFIEDVSTLIRHHLFEVESIAQNDSAIRRLIRRVGEERIERLLDLRRADIRGCGPRRKPSKAFEELAQRIKRIRKTKPPLSVRDLAVTGDDVMRWMKIGPGPKVGVVLQNILQFVLDQPKRNTKKELKAYITKALFTAND